MSRSEVSDSGDAAWRGTVLLGLARASVLQALGEGAGEAEGDLSAPWLSAPGATFVTLMKRGALRGCVGTLEARRPLRDDVRENARAAAFRDPRFPPLLRDELPEVAFEVSLLAASVPLPPSAIEAEALARLHPEIDGVVLDYRGRRATFLPQVWEQLPDPGEFLAQLKRKAGLPPGFWSPELSLAVYRVEKWKEPAP